MPSAQTPDVAPIDFEDPRTREERERHQRLIGLLIEKTQQGKVDWHQTADQHAFVTTLGESQTAEVGRWEGGYSLTVRDESGRTLVDLEEEGPWDAWQADGRVVLRYELQRLYRTALRQARDVVPDADATIAVLERL